MLVYILKRDVFTNYGALVKYNETLSILKCCVLTSRKRLVSQVFTATKSYLTQLKAPVKATKWTSS